MTSAKSYSIVQHPKFIKLTSLAVCPELQGGVALEGPPKSTSSVHLQCHCWSLELIESAFSFMAHPSCRGQV